MTIIVNGYAPGDTRRVTHAVRAEDHGHSIVETSTTRRGISFRFRYAVTCQCGKRYTSQAGFARAEASHRAHTQKETS